MESWYVAKTKPQKESGIIDFLSQWGIEVFYPRIEERTGRTSGLKPLFPTYMFCYFDPASSLWPTIRWAHGIAYFLGQDEGPTPVPASLVEYLQDKVSQWNYRDGARELVAGDRVVVLDGPFAGLEGIFQRYVPSRLRCSVLLEVIGQLNTVELPEGDVKELNQGQHSCRIEALQAAL